MTAALNEQQIKDLFKAATGPLLDRVAKLEGENAALKSDFEKVRRARVGAGRPVDQRTLAQIRDDFVADNDPNKGKGLKMGRYVRCLVLGHNHGAKHGQALTPAQAAEKILKDNDFAHEIDTYMKALGETSIAGGGALVPTMYAADLIEFLRARAIVRRSGPLTIPLPSGNLTMPKQTGAATASYVGENVAITPGSQTFANAKLNAKKLAALTVISNDLLRDSNPAVDILVRNDLSLQVGLREDLAFIRGTPTDYSPIGVLNAVSSANLIQATQAGSVATLQEVNQNLFQLMGALEDNNVALENLVFWMAPRSKRFLMTLRDGVGRPYFAEEMVERGTLLGIPFFCTTQIPANLGMGGNASEVYLVSMDQMLIGDNLDMELVVVPNGAWDNGSGTITSGLSNDQTVVRCISKHDMIMRHDFGGAVLQGVTWIA